MKSRPHAPAKYLLPTVLSDNWPLSDPRIRFDPQRVGGGGSALNVNAQRSALSVQVQTLAGPASAGMNWMPVDVFIHQIPPTIYVDDFRRAHYFFCVYVSRSPLAIMGGASSCHDARRDMVGESGDSCYPAGATRCRTRT